MSDWSDANALSPHIELVSGPVREPREYFGLADKLVDCELNSSTNQLS